MLVCRIVLAFFSLIYLSRIFVIFMCSLAFSCCSKNACSSSGYVTDLCLFAFGAMISFSENNWLLLCKIRVMVDSLTLACHLFSIQLTYSARDFLLSRAYGQSSYFCESVKVVLLFGGMMNYFY